MSEIQSYLNDESTVGRFDSTGVFTLDQGAAHRKVLEFFRERPGLWILKLAQAAVLLRATSAQLKIGFSTLSFEFVGASTAPSAEELTCETASEAARLVGTGLESAAAEMSSVRWLVTGSGRVPSGVLYELNERPVRLDNVQLKELISRLGIPLKNHVATVFCELRSESWWQTFRKNLRYRLDLVPFLKQHLLYSPLPIQVGLSEIGGGGIRARKEIACEYHLGQRKNDVIVGEREPGNGARAYEVFGEELPPLLKCPRVFSRWLLAEEHMFPALDFPFDPTIEYFQESTSGGPTAQKQRLRQNSIPFWTTAMGNLVIAKYVELPASFISQSYRHWAQSDAPGLHCHIMLSICYPWSELETVEFVRHGIALEKHSVDLGCPGLSAVVAYSKLKTDTTSMRIVQNESYQDLLQYLKHRYLSLLSKTLEVIKTNKWENEKPCKQLEDLAELLLPKPAD